MRLERLDHVALFVRDVHRSAGWYRTVLGLERRYEDAWRDYPIVMVAGDTGVALFPAHAMPAPPADPTRAPGRFAHVAFRTTAERLEEARRELRAQDVPFSEQDHQIARSIYLHDLDGHEVELTTYEVEPRGRS